MGDGPMREKLEEDARSIANAGSIEFLSGLSQEEVVQLMRRSLLLMLLSEAEAYGLVVSEALSNGTPCLVSDRMALAEFESEPGCFGYHGRHYDYSRIADMVESILDDPPVVGPFSEKIPINEQMVRRYIELYTSVLEEKDRAKDPN